MEKISRRRDAHNNGIITMHSKDDWIKLIFVDIMFREMSVAISSFRAKIVVYCILEVCNFVLCLFRSVYQEDEIYVPFELIDKTI